MESEETKKRNYKKEIIVLVFFLILVIGIVIFIKNIFGDKIVYTSSGDSIVETSSLYCVTKSKNIPSAFFDVSNSDSAEQTVKIIFRDEKIGSVAYNANVIYMNNTLAKQSEAELNIKYGFYMQDNGKEMTDFSPNFSVDGQNVKINLFATTEQLTPAIVKIFLIDVDNLDLNNYTINTLSALYKSKGFNCTIDR